MKIISLNLNGIRSAAKKGFYDWLSKQNADIVCLQETKAQAQDITDELFSPTGYHSYFVDAEKKGYSGVGIYTRLQPLQVIKKLNWHLADQEGRYLQVDFANFSVISLYLPSGSSGEERQSVKFAFLEIFKKHLNELRTQNRPYIICGDWNIAHTKKDIKNWKGNQKNSGFLPEERAWMDELLGPMGFVDAFRVKNQEDEQYTWWSNRGQAYAKNVGWRIDYQIVTPELADKIKDVSIFKDIKFSDHAPLIIEYAL